MMRVRRTSRCAVCVPGLASARVIARANGAVSSCCEYAPFGEPLVTVGPLADTFTHRFSTKPWCQVTRLCEYQCRKYNPFLGRWLSRDPIEENGGSGLYVICNNSVVNMVDIMGKECTPVSDPEVENNVGWSVCEIKFDSIITDGFAFISGMDVTWEIEGSVMCCCKYMRGLLTYTRKKKVYKKKTMTISFGTDYAISYAPASMTPTGAPKADSLSRLWGEMIAYFF